MKKKQFKYESLQDSESVKSYLKQLILGLEQGKLELKSSDDKLVLEPHGLMEFVFNATQSKSRQIIRFKLAWTPEDAPTMPDPDEILVIKTGE